MKSLAKHKVIVSGIMLVSASLAGAQSSTPGKWSRQTWEGLTGTTVSSLTGSPSFYQAPSSTDLVDSSYLSFGDNYGARTRGYITPETSGVYTFWVAGDEEAQLLLSPNDQKWQAAKLAGASVATSQGGFDDYYVQRSAPRFLNAGQKYYVEVLHKEGTGSDHAAVSWALQEAVIGTNQNWASSACGSIAYSSSNQNNVYPPSKGIDNDPNTFFHTTLNDVNAWWMVDFRQDRLVNRIELLNRPDCCQARASNFRATLEDVNGAVVAYKDFYKTSGSMGASETWNLTTNVAARRLKIQFLGQNREGNYALHLAEVQAYGPDLALKNWIREPGVTATESTNQNNVYPASNAIDGNVNTFQHTTSVAGSWLQVDLGVDRSIDTVELVNRQDGCQERLSNFRVSVLDGTGAVVTSQDFYTTSGQVKGALRWELPATVTGRSIKVQLLGLNRGGNYYLHVAEVNAWGRSNPAAGNRGLRAAVPASVMASYDPSTTDDSDDDFLLDSWEAAHGFAVGYETGTHGAQADPDGDLRNNMRESQQNTDPFVAQGEPGFLSHAAYTGLPYLTLTKARQDARYFQAPTSVALASGSLVTGLSSNSAGRVRGTVSPPQTGYYRFWIASGETGELWLSTDSTNRFRKQLICEMSTELGSAHGTDLTSTALWDSYGFQMSDEVYLEAGKSYFLEADYQIEHGGSRFVGIAWAKRDGPRALIPAECLNSFVPDLTDGDDDGLPDAWENQYPNKLSVTDGGGIDPEKQGEFGDYDGDGVNNHDEYVVGTDPTNADTDGDGVSDLEEIHSRGTNPLVADAAADVLVGTVDLSTATSSTGTIWNMTSGGLLANSFRGEANWAFTVPSAGNWLLRMRTELMGNTYGNEKVPVVIKVDGQFVCRTEIVYGTGLVGMVQGLTPYLSAGSHQVSVLIDNALARRMVRIISLEIFQPADSAMMLAQMNHVTPHAPGTRTMPFCLEGYARDASTVTINNAAAINGIGGGHWYANLPLADESGPQSYTVNFESGFGTTGSITWLPTNVIDGETLAIRSGDSLRLGAWGTDPDAPSTLTVQQTEATPVPSAYAGYLPTTAATATVVATGTTLSSVTTAGGIMNGNAIGQQMFAATNYFSNNGTTATYQLQFFDGNYTKVAKVQLSQSGTNITAYQVYARYKSGNYVGSNFDTISCSSMAAGTTGYGVNSLTLSSLSAPDTRSLTGSASVPFLFQSPGTYAVTGSVSGGASATLTVKVCLAPTFNATPIDTLIASSRSMTWNATPEVTFDIANVACKLTTTHPNATQSTVRLLPTSPVACGLAARVGFGGPILAIQPINVISLSDSFQNDLNVPTPSNLSGYKLGSSPITVLNLPSGGRVEASIFRAGVLFPNGTTLQTIYPENLVNGSFTLNFLIPFSIGGGFCYTLRVYDRNGIQL